MQRNMDLVRDLLLFVETNGKPMVEHTIELEGYDNVTTQHHIHLLKQAGFLTALEIPDSNLTFNYFDDIAITWPGHEFLDLIRDNAIWRKTKAAAKEAGTWSVANLAAVAVAIGKVELSRITGMEIS